MFKRNKATDKKTKDTGKNAMEAGASGEKSEPKAEAGGDDLSMEEILQSIRRIIADDEGDDAEEPAEAAKPASKKDNGKGTSMKDDEDVPGSNMLELTEMLSEDGTVVSVKDEPEKASKEKKADAEPASFDILNQIDEALDDGDKKDAPAAEEKPAEDVVETPAEEPKAEEPAEEKPVAAAAVSEKPAAKDDDYLESLISEDAAKAASSAFDKLKTADAPKKPAPASSELPPMRSGATVEDMIADMLRPMLKSWLDENLPHIVEDIVEREVKKLTR